jgi:hypothetical protein
MAETSFRAYQGYGDNAGFYKESTSASRAGTTLAPGAYHQPNHTPSRAGERALLSARFGYVEP